MSREDSRWTYLHGSRPEGVAVYDDTKLHSHHDTDPARGQHNAFDLVRLHRFGHLDKDCANDTPVTERPSFAAMCDFAAGTDNVRTNRASEEFVDLGESKPETKVSPFRVVPASEFAGQCIEPDWQVHELVPLQGTGLDTGASGTGKSFKTLYVATCIHLGVECYGLPVRRGRACIIVAEGSNGYRYRLQALAKHLDVPLSELPAVIPAAPNLFKPEQVAELIRELKAYAPTYVVVDTKWRCSVGASEDSASDNAIVYGSADRIAREVGCFVTMVAHVGNQEQGRVRGSSSQFAAVDVEVLHTRGANHTGTSKVTKLKDAADGKAFNVRLVPVELGVSAKTGKAYGSLVVEHAPGLIVETTEQPKGANQVAAYAAVKGGATSLYDAISAALKARGIKPADATKHERRNMRSVFTELAAKNLIVLDLDATPPTVGLPTADWLSS